MKEYLVDQIRRGFGGYLFCWSLASLILGHKEVEVYILFLLSAILFGCNFLVEPKKPLN